MLLWFYSHIVLHINFNIRMNFNIIFYVSGCGWDNSHENIYFNICLNFKLIFSLDKHYVFMKIIVVICVACKRLEGTKKCLKQIIVLVVRCCCFHNSFTRSLSLWRCILTDDREKAFRTLILEMFIETLRFILLEFIDKLLQRNGNGTCS